MTAVGEEVLRDKLESARSKNAGPFCVTMDLFFGDLATFRQICDQKVVTPEVCAGLYGIDASQVRVFNFEPALAIKVSIPRLVPGGSPDDIDVAGGQQFAPLMDIPI